MNIQTNILRHALKNVYFLSGNACGGKTILSRMLAEKHGFVLYDMDAVYDIHRAIADEAYMHYRGMETACVNAPGAWADAGRLTHIHAADGTSLLVSTFRHRTRADRYGVFFCAVGDPLAPSRTVTVQFRGPEDTALVYRSPTGKQTLTPDGDGWYRVPLAVCAGGWIAED